MKKRKALLARWRVGKVAPHGSSVDSVGESMRFKEQVYGYSGYGIITVGLFWGEIAMAKKKKTTTFQALKKKKQLLYFGSPS